MIGHYEQEELNTEEVKGLFFPVSWANCPDENRVKVHSPRAILPMPSESFRPIPGPTNPWNTRSPLSPLSPFAANGECDTKRASPSSRRTGPTSPKLSKRLSPAEKIQVRRMKNRESARRSQERREALLHDMEKNIQELEMRNEALRQRVVENTRLFDTIRRIKTLPEDLKALLDTTSEMARSLFDEKKQVT